MEKPGVWVSADQRDGEEVAIAETTHVLRGKRQERAASPPASAGSPSSLEGEPRC